MHRIALIVQAIDRDQKINPVGQDAEELRHISQWLRYRLAKAGLRATAPTAE